MKKILTLCSAVVMAITMSVAGNVDVRNIKFEFAGADKLAAGTIIAGETPAYPAETPVNPGETTADDGKMMAPASEQATLAVPVDLRLRKTTYNMAEFEWCYNGYYEEGGFAHSIWKKNGDKVELLVGAFTSFSEIAYLIYLDEVSFKEYDEYDCYVESHYYISTYWILNCPSGIVKGDNTELWNESVYETGSGKDNYFMLHSGEYYYQVQELTYDGGGNPVVNKEAAQVKFELADNAVKNLKAVVSPNNQKATITWEEPLLPAGVHLYVNVQSGAKVAYDNLNEKTTPAQPLEVAVEEGRTYSVTAQYVKGNGTPMGGAVKIYFTTGTNPYTITSAKAEVTKEDYVDFSWEASKAADYYNVIVYRDGGIYAEYTATSKKLTKQIPTGTYSWKVAAYEKSESDGMFYPITEYVAGNNFTTKSPDLPEGTLELNVIGLEAFYMSDYATQGNYPWLISIATGSEATYGRPNPWIIIWSDREYAISGNYSPTLQNVEIASTAGDGSLMNYTGELSGASTATNATLKLEFEGFDMDYKQMDMYIPYYSGEFTMTCADGKSYYGRINQMICGAYPYSELFSVTRSTVLSMYMEEGGEAPHEGIEEVLSGMGLDLSQPMYNIVGQQVDAEYKGIVIQNGKKYLVK